MTKAEEDKFELLNILWVSKINDAKRHLESASAVIRDSNPINKQLFELEKKYNIKRKTQ